MMFVVFIIVYIYHDHKFQHAVCTNGIYMALGDSEKERKEEVEREREREHQLML